MVQRCCAAFAACLFGGCLALAQVKLAPEPERRTPEHVAAKLSAADRAIFDNLVKLELESLWAGVSEEGYQNCFINELTALKPGVRMIGRALTVRYLPNRKDLREKLYSAGPQLNYRSSEEAEPGDILVFDAGGETRSAVTGAMTATRFAYRGGVGMVADGAFRDVPGFAQLPIQIYMRRGQAGTVSPHLMSVDYQVPVRIGGVTVIPGDILFGEEHGILVIPADVVEKVIEKAQARVEREEFQQLRMLEGDSIYEVYPRLSEENQKRFEERKRRQP